MTASRPPRERTYLWVSVAGNLVLGCVGLVAALLSASQAILLDGLFNLTYLVTGLIALRVASLLQQGDTARFPLGYTFFEPLVNGIKGTLVLGVSVMAAIGAVQALLSGGRGIAAGLAIVYGIFASVACWLVAWITHRGARATGSPLVRVDAANWILNAAISSCVLLAFCGIAVLERIDLEAWAPYVDPALVLTVVLISIGVPVRMSWQALMALLNRAPAPEVIRQVTERVDRSLEPLAPRERFVRVVQPGRQRIVLIHVVLADPDASIELRTLDAARRRTEEALRELHSSTVVDVLFTGDRRWGAPLGSGGSGGGPGGATEES